MSKNLPTRFSAKDIAETHARWEEDHREWKDRKPDKTPRDFEELGAYLSSFPFVWKVREVHDEPIPGTSASRGGGMGGTPQMRIKGFLEGPDVKFGEFEVTFHGRRINVVLPPERQAIFERAIAALPDLTQDEEHG